VIDARLQDLGRDGLADLVVFEAVAAGEIAAPRDHEVRDDGAIAIEGGGGEPGREANVAQRLPALAVFRLVDIVHGSTNLRAMCRTTFRELRVDLVVAFDARRQTVDSVSKRSHHLAWHDAVCFVSRCW
jgi:hypothetical protein